MSCFPAQVSAYPRIKLYEGKGLYNIIITTNSKAFYLICIFDSGSQKKDRAGYVITDTLANF